MMSNRCIQSFKTQKLRVQNLSKKKKKGTEVSRSCIVWKILKGIIFTICLTLFFYQSTAFLLDYYTYPISRKTEFTHPVEFENPAVTFCSFNPLKRSKFCAEYPDLCESPVNITLLCEMKPFLCKDNPSNILIPKLGFFASDSHEEVFEKVRQTYMNGNVTKEYWEEWAWSIKSRGSDVKPVFALVSTMYFPCYSNNLLINSTDEPLKIKLGSQLGQQLICWCELDLKGSDAIDLGLKPVVFMSIHSPFVPVNPFSQRIFLKGGYKYNIHVRLEEETHEINCINYEDLWIESSHHAPRSQEMCEELCLHDLFQRNKNMTPAFNILEYPLELCWDEKCKTSIEDGKVLDSCKKNCRKGCRNLKYTSTIVETMLENPEEESRAYEKDKIEVKIYLEDRQVVVEKFVPLYDIGHLFSYIGGLMGGWLGFSIWSFAGIAEDISRRVTLLTEHVRRYFRGTPGAQHSISSTRPNRVFNIRTGV